ncbi:alpha/beta hydrolase [Cupriavidus sp. 2TAF22]|uniref:alpha/beta hydrolase n=1 Tax=unclassified Cupriavidus TaxID=2640874 RepID=UPI003F91D73E
MASQQREEIIQRLWDDRARLPEDASLSHMREHADALYDALPIPAGVRFVEGSDVPGLWTISPGSASNQAILYLHGGGYVLHTPCQYRTMTAALSRETHRDVFALDYHRAPEHPFPHALHAAYEAYKWLHDRLGEDPAIVLAGDSAGGGLAVALMLMCKLHDMPLPKGAFLMSPWTDLTLSGDTIRTKALVDARISLDALRFFARSYLQEEHDPRHPLASPVFGDLGGLPPILIHVGGDEILLDDATRLAARAAVAGVDIGLRAWPAMFHAWHMWHGILPEARQALQEGADFIRGRFAA